ncbi:MAG TPA: hypothetical protein VM925_37830 [Labilithrix sp.]|jgi:hypothetical protein|nr:hypothetical protein [Labilithrix sp.]
MRLEVTDIATPDLVTETAMDARRIEARLVGCAEPVNFDDLTTYLEAIHRAAAEIDAGEVVLDIRSVDFMSATCLGSLLAWISESQRRSQFSTRVVWDPTKPWQRRSLQNIVSTRGELLRID